MHATLPLPDVWPHPTIGVLTDIDDTLTHDGHIEPEALAALHSLRAAGVPVVAITGRPVGWSTPFAQAWPVDAIVAENGSVRLRTKGTLLQKHYLLDEATRAEQYAPFAARAAPD
jgi:HAD superfamily hydrolase (TIGR01484 family)